MVADPENPSVRKKADATLNKLFRQVLAWEGSITGEHGIGLARLPWWKLAVPEGTRDIHRRIKSALDPEGLLNPGKFV
jgi:glycolate oxidase